jgi:hypothetical protein
MVGAKFAGPFAALTAAAAGSVQWQFLACGHGISGISGSRHARRCSTNLDPCHAGRRDATPGRMQSGLMQFDSM